MKGIWFRRSVVMLALVLLVGVLAVRAIDYLHSRVVAHRYENWQAEVARDADGVRMDFQPMTAGEGKRAMLFVHGFASPPSLFRYFVPHFAERGYVCRAMRLPGFGEPIEQAAQVTREDWIAAVRKEASTLREDREAVWIVAHSLGAAITLRALQEEPGLADGLVLLAPLFRVSDRRSPMLSPDEWFRVGQEVVVHSRMTESLFPIDAHDERLRKANERDLFTSLNIYVELFALLEELNGLGSHPEIPVLMVLSARDEIVDLHAAREWFGTLTGAAHRLIVVEPAGHLLPLDTGWEDLLVEVASYIFDYSDDRRK